MEVKMFEIRDRGTFIAAMAIRLGSRNEAERFLLSKSGYGKHTEDHAQYVVLCKIDGSDFGAQYDPWSWGSCRTMPQAHNHIHCNWDRLQSGQVIDVEYILGERETPKTSEKELSHAI